MKQCETVNPGIYEACMWGGVGPLAMVLGPSLIERKTKNAGGRDWAFISKGSWSCRDEAAGPMY